MKIGDLIDRGYTVQQNFREATIDILKDEKVVYKMPALELSTQRQAKEALDKMKLALNI